MQKEFLRKPQKVSEIGACLKRGVSWRQRETPPHKLLSPRLRRRDLFLSVRICRLRDGPSSALHLLLVEARHKTDLQTYNLPKMSP